MDAVTLKDVFALIGLMITIIVGYGKLMSKIKELELRVAMMEKQDDKILMKLDKIADQIADIKEDLSYKQDKQ